ncbi:MAG: phosphatase PAP2 family protein [Candidatus Dormibacteria bacterium]
MIERLNMIRRPGPLVAVSLVYLALASGLMIWRGISVSPDYLLVLMVPLAVLSGRLSRFLRDWVPFVAIFLGWEAMRGIAPRLGIAPHVADLAQAELWLFGGHLPTQVLQSLTAGAAEHPAAVVATVVYFCHFVFPLGVGLVLWLVDRRQFLRYTTCLMAMALATFIIFLLVPTAPPWYAEGDGLLHGFRKLIDTALPSEVSPYYHSLNPNPVAAFPSLHAAFPFLSFLALRPVYGRASWLALAWCLLVWLSVVYLGEHYVLDVIAGVVLAAGSWYVLMRVAAPRIPALRSEPIAPEGDGASERMVDRVA